jgi:hypothetical protein
MPVASALALLLVAPAAGTGAPEAGTAGVAPTVAPTVAGDPADEPAPAGTDAISPAFPDGPARGGAGERARVAAEHHAARRYAEAALEYEALFAELSEPGHLLQAARARAAAGHHAHAVAYLSRLLASGKLTAADTQVAYGELQAAQRGVTPVTVRVELASDQRDASPWLTAQFVPHFASEQRPPLEFPLPPGAGPVRVVMLQLDPGVWRLQVDDPALAPVDVQVEVLAQPGDPVLLDLRPPPEDTGLPPPQRRRLIGVLGGLGGAVLGVGVGLTVRGELAQFRPALSRPGCDDLLTCRRSVASAASGRSTGAALIGAGAGMLVGGLTGMISDPRQRRLAWILELALGGAGVVGGSFAVALAARGFDRENVTQGRPWGDPTYVGTIDRRADQHTIAAAGLGLGSGLAFSAAAGLLRTRVHYHRQRVRPALGVRPGGLALSISGAF